MRRGILRVPGLFESAEIVRLVACAFGCPDDSIELVGKFAVRGAVNHTAKVGNFCR